MTLEQTVDLPEYAANTPVFLQCGNDHRPIAEFRLPRDLPAGKVKVEVTVTPEVPAGTKAGQEKAPYAWRTLRGMGKGSKWTTEELLKERARDLLMEEAKLFGKISPEALERAKKRGVTPAELGLEEYM